MLFAMLNFRKKTIWDRARLKNCSPKPASFRKLWTTE